MLSNQLSTTKLNQIMSAKVMKALAEKYGFDAKEAKEFLIEEGILKAPKKRVTTPKADKPKKDKSDKPKKAKSGYLLHNDAEREGIKIKLEKDAEESGETLKSSEIIVALGAHWKALSDDDKKAWNDKAKALKMIASDSEDNVTEDEVAEDDVEVTEHDVEVTEDDVTEDEVEVTEDDVEVKKEKVKKEKVEKEENSENDE